jgi:hypothetical protein
MEGAWIKGIYCVESRGRSLGMEVAQGVRRGADQKERQRVTHSERTEHPELVNERCGNVSTVVVCELHRADYRDAWLARASV